MSDFSQAVREKAAAMVNAQESHLGWRADEIAQGCVGRALCQAVQDGALHLDPVELDKARWEEAEKITPASYGALALIYRRLVRDRWTPPEPVDPVKQVAREVAGQYKSHPDPRIEAEAIATFAIRAWIERNGQ